MAKDYLSKLAFVDVETTGTSAAIDRIIDVGIIRVEEGKIVEEFDSLINPQSHISPYIISMTTITPEMLARAPTFEEIKCKVYSILKGATFVAHNAHFDYAFIKNEFARYETKFSAKMLCTVRLSRILFPSESHHNLDAIINRFSIDVGQRHRAYPDAKALYLFLESVKKLSSEEALRTAVKNVTKRPSLPPALNYNIIKNIPNAPGVYIFYDKDGTPLYVGKSTHLKDRVLSHFSSFHTNPTDMKLADLVADIEIIKKGGDLSASLLEAELIKKFMPLFNKRLREMREVSVLIKNTKTKFHRIEIKRIKLPFEEDYENILAVYPSIKKAKNEVYDAIKENKICPKMLGLEKGRSSCFNYQIGKCEGACVGEESSLKHNVKLIEAFGERFIPKWPFKGKIYIKEESDGISELTYINNWMHIAVKRKNGDSEEIYEEKESKIYSDTVKILKRFLFRKDYLNKIYPS